jgi:hypothetical protein
VGSACEFKRGRQSGYRVLTGRNEELLREIWEFFKEIGSVQAEYDKAVSHE